MIPALELRALTKTYQLKTGQGLFAGMRDHTVVQDVNLSLMPNEIMGLVGESGSGKTTTGMMALRLTEPSSGQILVGGTDITTLAPTALKPYRRRMQVVFQDSYSALDPMMTLEQIIAEPLHIHGIGTQATRRTQALDWLVRAGLHRSQSGRYPHELSGGQRQRVAIARALILEPSVLVADEPTSALDVSIKAQIINLLMDLQRDMGLSILFISHDLSVVRALTDRVAVMQQGRIVELAPTESLFAGALHPYSRALLDAIPVLNPSQRRRRIFPDPAALIRDIPRLAAASSGATPGPTPQLVTASPGHLVEAVVT
ncbi:MAG: ATP-binding cassette domain-containing protein [bacterium]